jgi:hypothetical protein
MLISGGGFCFAEPPGSGKRSTVGGTDLRFSLQANASRPVNPQQNATSGNGLLRNASKCSETFRNALARMTYCLGPKSRMAKKLNLQESRVVISCLYSLTACRPVEF